MPDVTEAANVSRIKKEALEIGGDRFQIPGIIERDLRDEIDRSDWRAFGPTTRMAYTVRGIRMEPRQCHTNSALLALANGWECWTGLALSNDGTWRTHSWVRVPSSGAIYETTLPRVSYYGVKLSRKQTIDMINHAEG